MNAAASPRVLIIRLSAIGDVLITTPVSRALRTAFPNAYLAWIVEPKARDILVGNPYLDEVIVWQRGRGAAGWLDLPRLTRRLKGKQFDWAIDCQGLFRSAGVGRLSGAARLVGNTPAREEADRFYHVRVPRREDPSSRQRCLDLLQPLGVQSTDRRMVLELSPEEVARAAGLLRLGGGEPGEPYACLVPATTWPQKHWFEEQWSELAGGLWRSLRLRPVLMGSKADTPSIERIAAGAGAPCVISAGKTSLKEAAAILAGAAVTVSVDTALMHASAAVGTPTIALCGASNWTGFQDYERFKVLREPLPCSPCVHRPTCGGRFDCMRALTTSRVLLAVEELLSVPSGATPA